MQFSTDGVCQSLRCLFLPIGLAQNIGVPSCIEALFLLSMKIPWVMFKSHKSEDKAFRPKSAYLPILNDLVKIASM